MKKTMLVLGIFFLGGLTLQAADTNNQALAGITNHYAARNFTAGAVSRADLDRILLAGVRAPSASNRQPWHFTVIQNAALSKQIVPNMPEGNVLILISGADGQTNSRVILDCALAAENIYLAAQALGLGSRIYTGPMDALNRNAQIKAELDLPNGYNPVALVRVGQVPPGIDAVSAASSRKDPDAVVNYK
ncbi:MAG: nitroreductase family protein [Treponema sp.]|jgi:nitroreductase|nr:nitroreductase family protein [Treponema sp.]